MPERRRVAGTPPPAIAAAKFAERYHPQSYASSVDSHLHGISVTDFVISYVATDDNPADGGTKALDRYKQALSAVRLLGKSEATTNAV